MDVESSKTHFKHLKEDLTKKKSQFKYLLYLNTFAALPCHQAAHSDRKLKPLHRDYRF